jgi:hypothetical protein
MYVIKMIFPHRHPVLFSCDAPGYGEEFLIIHSIQRSLFQAVGRRFFAPENRFFTSKEAVFTPKKRFFAPGPGVFQRKRPG